MDKSKIIITINAQYGSPFQKKIFEETLELVLKGVIGFQNDRHKNNKIKYDIKKTH